MRLTLNSAKRQLRRVKGQASVEFALIALVLLAILFGILEGGRLMLINSSVENGAREGAHYLALNPRADVEDLCEAILPKMPLVDKEHLTISRDEPSCAFCPVTVQVTYRWHSFVGILNLGPIELKATSTKLLEISPSAGQEQQPLSERCPPPEMGGSR
jgi:hypothetical protein